MKLRSRVDNAQNASIWKQQMKIARQEKKNPC